METQRMKLTKVNSDWLPLDLIMDILKRLPVKTLIRFLSISKLWSSIIRSRDFMKLFMNVSLTKPRGRLIFFFQQQGFDRSLVVSQNTNDLSSLTMHTGPVTTFVPSVHGLICYGHSNRLAIYNPCTRRSINLPEMDTWRRPINHYLGYDPIDNDYKVLCVMTGPMNGLVGEIQVLKVGIGNSWKKIENSFIPHSPFEQELCMSGVLYYQALTGTKVNDSAIISFDVRSEKFCSIKAPFSFWHRSSKLTSYEGKLAVTLCQNNFRGGFGIALCVLEDAAKEEWSKKTFVLPGTIMPARWLGRFHTNETEKGEIIFAPTYLPASLFSLVYFDMKTNSAKTVDIQGTKECMGYSKSVSSNLVDNLMCL